MKAINITWDTDDENPEDIGLPEEVEIPENIKEEDVSDYLSDTYGYCHYGYSLID